MEELEIEISCLQMAEYDLTMLIRNPFEYGRDTSTEEILALAPLIQQLSIVVKKIKCLTELKEAIQSNKAISIRDKNK